MEGRPHLSTQHQHHDAAGQGREQKPDAEGQAQQRGIVGFQSKEDEAVGEACLAHAPAADRNRQRRKQDRNRHDEIRHRRRKRDAEALGEQNHRIHRQRHDDAAQQQAGGAGPRECGEAENRHQLM